MRVEDKMEWSEIESIDGDKKWDWAKGIESGNKSGGIMTIICEVGLKVNLMWGWIKG